MHASGLKQAPNKLINTNSAALGSRRCQKQRVGLAVLIVAQEPHQKQRI